VVDDIFRNMYLKFEVDTFKTKKSLVKNNIYLKYEVDSLRNKEVTVRNNFKIPSSREDKSENIGARVMNLVT
jgi:hypothetical protein